MPFSGGDTSAIVLVLSWLLIVTLSFILLPKFNKILFTQPQQVLSPTPPAPLEVEKVETTHSPFPINTGFIFITELKELQGVVEDDKLKESIQQLIGLSEIVLKRHDDQTDKFFLRYSDKLISLLNKYDEIENTRLNSPDILKTMQYIRDSVE